MKPPKRAQESTLEQERPVWFDNGAFDEQDDDHNNSSQQQQSQLWDADYEMDQAGESGGEEGQGQKRKGGAPKALPAAEFFKPTQSSQSSRKRKKQKAEGMSSEDDTDDGDFDYDEKAPSKKRAAPKTQPKPRVSPTGTDCDNGLLLTLYVWCVPTACAASKDVIRIPYCQGCEQQQQQQEGDQLR